MTKGLIMKNLKNLKVLKIKENDKPVVKRIKKALADGTLWIRTAVDGDRHVCSLGKKKLADASFYIEIVCQKRIGEVKHNFTGRFFEFKILK